jgi:hypothetical protein
MAALRRPPWRSQAREAMLMVSALKSFCASLIVGLPVLAGLMSTGAGAARAFEITQAIPSVDKTACVDAQDRKTANGTPVLAYPCNDGINEHWVFNKQGFLQEIGGAKCIERTAANQAILGDCRSTWTMSYGYLAEPGGCLDSKGKYGSGAQLVMDTCANAASQAWVLRNILIEQPMPKTIDTACVDVRGSAIAEHTPVDAHACSLGANERWTLVGGRLRGIGTTKGVATCLGEAGGGAVELQACLDPTAKRYFYQLWSLAWTTIGIGANTRRPGGLLNIGSAACLDSKGDYVNFQLHDTACTATTPSASQTWVLK